MGKGRADALLRAQLLESRATYLDAEKALSEDYRARVAGRRAGARLPPPAPLPPREKPALPGIKMLCIGDSHAHPDHPNHRYEWLGRFVVDQQPDIVWDCGDWDDMPSLSAYDRKGSMSFEGRRYWLDIEAGIDAMERFQAQIDDYNRGRKKKYQPRLIRTLGNHEHRIERVINEEPRFAEIIGTRDLLSAEFGWEEYPFLEPLVVQGVAICHYFTSGVMGRPIGGENPAAMLLKRQFHSAIQGHSHQLDYCDRTDAAGHIVQAMHAGCYFDYDFDWAGKQSNRMYARGLLLLHNVHDGTFDPEWWSMDRIQERYS